MLLNADLRPSFSPPALAVLLTWKVDSISTTAFSLVEPQCLGRKDDDSDLMWRALHKVLPELPMYEAAVQVYALKNTRELGYPSLAVIWTAALAMAVSSCNLLRTLLE